MQSAAETAERVARESYGRLLAWLAWQWRDIAAAEDALAEAFARALLLWPERGIPENPEGWLLATAKSQLLMAARHRRVREDPVTLATLAMDEVDEGRDCQVPDHRLRLMYVCTHPAIEPSMRCALMLQTVLGIDAARIAQAFLVSPEAVTKRLVRVKGKIRQTAIRFELPDPQDLASRSEAVLEAIYGAYSLAPGYSESEQVLSLSREAMYLADLLATLIPKHAEAHGLAALLSFCESRRRARTDAQGRLVPIDQQDTRLWNGDMIERGNERLERAIALRAPGPYQYEAAIQAAHCQRAVTGVTPWSAIARLYENLLAVGASHGAVVGHALAVAHANELPQEGLRLLDLLDPRIAETYASWWAAKGHLLAKTTSLDLAVAAYERAIYLTSDPLQRDYLRARILTCRNDR